ncbi:hypothetical protein [Ureaplasma urealyticum]|uniref:Uncharacterized protein n=2 Tax=Ureaplasma urealyticum TaxID=2130 RepID=A0AAP9ADC5_UREUR|nr:hypothetical protein [Ureaplasma urealyticum]EEH01717.1 conserved hypothetical protein [Ureaplasma urealyticum serovar 8 str. ATCC 27618]EEH02402.1 conserved hypothetical protein [Ureaplasma urealyticum serovar 2 str. ATCC 27814]MCF1349218.1 hypothetical protein [Ureaplasma urealyticum]MDU3864562.1 hypothetical protein [Ureaplasma urealyticum]QDI63916.1 hypothetical protein EPH05_03050 [Ureaplasma urealyticum]
MDSSLKRQKRRNRMIISLIFANIAWIGIITAIVLCLKNKEKNHKNFVEEDHKISHPSWEYDKDGNLKFILN